MRLSCMIRVPLIPCLIAFGALECSEINMEVKRVSMDLTRALAELPNKYFKSIDNCNWSARVRLYILMDMKLQIISGATQGSYLLAWN